MRPGEGRQSRGPHPGLRLGGLLLVLVLGGALVPPAAGADVLGGILSEAYDQATAQKGEGIAANLAVSEEEKDLVRKGIELMVEAGYDAPSVLSFLDVAQALSTAGIGVRDITNKLREGMAKHIGQDRVLAVIERRAQALRDARTQVISCEEKGVVFLDRQMACTVLADYMSRGISPDKLRDCLAQGHMEEFPALANLIR